MKYCSKCGKQLENDAIVCIGCGRLIYEQNQLSQSYYQSQAYSNHQDYKPSSLSITANTFMIIGTVLRAIFSFGISLAWCLPMSISYSKKINSGIKVSIKFKVCALLFVSLISGVLMLCDDKN